MVRGVQVDRRWLVYLPSTEPPGEPEPVPERAGTPELGRNTSAVPGTRTGEDTAAAIIREAIAPFVAQLAVTHEELGEARNELHHERTRREEAERARDALQARVDALTGAETYRGAEAYPGPYARYRRRDARRRGLDRDRGAIPTEQLRIALAW